MHFFFSFFPFYHLCLSIFSSFSSLIFPSIILFFSLLTFPFICFSFLFISSVFPVFITSHIFTWLFFLSFFSIYPPTDLSFLPICPFSSLIYLAGLTEQWTAPVKTRKHAHSKCKTHTETMSAYLCIVHCCMHLCLERDSKRKISDLFPANKTCLFFFSSQKSNLINKTSIGFHNKNSSPYFPPNHLDEQSKYSQRTHFLNIGTHNPTTYSHHRTIHLQSYTNRCAVTTTSSLFSLPLALPRHLCISRKWGIFYKNKTEKKKLNIC